MAKFNLIICNILVQVFWPGCAFSCISKKLLEECFRKAMHNLSKNSKVMLAEVS